MDKKGGRFSLTISGRTYSGRGVATLNPARATPSTGVNQDGTGYVTVTPQLARLSLSLDRGSGFFWTEGELLPAVDVTFIEDDVGVTHYLTQASWDGQPSVDSGSGEVTGMTLASDRYKATR
ncbi:phage tail tube protein [Hansschlegelia zhihuaiae]|uniref:Phage tail protein n=1 Tax=Hansschlegelia zhihuaiae TaxID=405005 RepID=A0A4Q0M4V6_9HYPH|nr:phage tail tube protein [Hansschlegelia zhihuaiae]RXF67686.1 hypothetical protein EK403_21015 [Hansschlegelia zhihuaiae]